MFDRSFFEDLNWLLETWIDDETEELFDARKVADIEDRLERMPFEEAVKYKHCKDKEFVTKCLLENASWRTNVSTVMTMSKEEKIQIHGYFEYMCYFVINAREELLHDILTDLGLLVADENPKFEYE
jgi:hypothetical protein